MRPSHPHFDMEKPLYLITGGKISMDTTFVSVGSLPSKDLLGFSDLGSFTVSLADPSSSESQQSGLDLLADVALTTTIEFDSPATRQLIRRGPLSLKRKRSQRLEPLPSEEASTAAIQTQKKKQGSKLSTNVAPLAKSFALTSTGIIQTCQHSEEFSGRDKEFGMDAAYISQVSGQTQRTLETRVHRFARQILAFIAVNGSIAEPPVRATFGNTPDISKALRLLVTEGKVKRTGRGGRNDPFTYLATGSGPASPGGVPAETEFQTLGSQVVGDAETENVTLFCTCSRDTAPEKVHQETVKNRCELEGVDVIDITPSPLDFQGL